MKGARKQEGKGIDFSYCGHRAKNTLRPHVEQIKERRRGAYLPSIVEEVWDDFGCEIPTNHLKKEIAAIRVQRPQMSEDREEESIATPKDMKERMRGQLQKCQELARAGKLTPEWQDYLEKHCGNGVRKETI